MKKTQEKGATGLENVQMNMLSDSSAAAPVWSKASDPRPNSVIRDQRLHETYSSKMHEKTRSRGAEFARECPVETHTDMSAPYAKIYAADHREQVDLPETARNSHWECGFDFYQFRTA